MAEAAVPRATRQLESGGSFACAARMLVLGCSVRQRPASVPLPAIERYDGPSFRVLRRFLRSPASKDTLSIFVLSAEHGLIPGSQSILRYDCPMTSARARELAPLVTERLAGLLAAALTTGIPTDFLICCTRAYLVALGTAPQDFARVLPNGSRVQVTPFRPGERLAWLHDWLYGSPPPMHVQAIPPDRAGRSVMVQLRGVRASWSSDGLKDRGREAILSAGAVGWEPASWAVDLGDIAVSPKWLVGIGFGLPHTAFGTTEALRVLAGLGITARRHSS